MSAPKRGGAFNHGERNTKRHQPGRPTYDTASFDNRSNERPNKPQQRSDSGTPNQPTLTTADMQTGLVSLLDRFVADETTPAADKDILHHARELRRLLCARGNPSSNLAKRDLDEKRPDRVASVVIPDYVERRVQEGRGLPPLPPIVESHLHNAVFTHRSAHVNPGNPSSLQNIDLGLDYERLELLGDAYIELIASRALYNRFPQVDVPELCSWRERLVENSALSKFSEAYGFADRLNHRSQWEPSSKAWMKVIADIFEAYVAALVLSNPEHGFEIAEAWLTELWAPQLLGFREKVVENLQARNELNKLICVKDVKLDYRQEKPMIYDSGSIQRYFIGIYLTGWGHKDAWLGSGEGQNKHQASVAAATAAIKNSAIVKEAAQKKAELLETKRKEQESEDKAETGPPVSQDLKNGTQESVSKKRLNDSEEQSPDKKKRKNKKDQKAKDAQAANLEKDKEAKPAPNLDWLLK